MKEVYFHCRDRDAELERDSRVHSRPPMVERAIARIEAGLFEPMSMPALAEACGTSTSTLLRAFKRALGTSPSAYHRQRRLEESMMLLKSKRYSVSEVAAMVGYDNIASFSHAFRREFDRSPSEVRDHDLAR